MPDRLEQLKTEQAAALAELKADFQKKKREAPQFFQLKRRAIRHDLAEKLIEARRRREEKQLAKRQARQEFLAAVKVYYVSHYSAASQFRKKGIRTAEEVHSFMKERELARREKRVKLKPRGKLIDPAIESAIRRFHCCGGSKNNFYRVWARYRERGITTAEGIIAYNIARGRTGPGKARLYARGPRKNPPPGYDFLRNIFPRFNEVRASVGLPPLSSIDSLGAFIFSEKISPLDGYYGVYHVDQLLTLAARPYRRRRSPNLEKMPAASEEELASGQWLTIKEFASIAAISYSRAHYQAFRRNFHQRYHPVSNLILIHAPTAAAYFLDLASKNASKK